MNASVGPPPTLVRPQNAWPLVLGLVGLDYFSTLGYQPTIAYQAAGVLAPLATLVLVLVTLFGVLPLYWYLAGRSPHGEGSLAVLERVLPGWTGKLLLVVLLGFAATDFVFTKTLSAADAAEHLRQNPLPAWQAILQDVANAEEELCTLTTNPTWIKVLHYWDEQMVVTVLLLIVGFSFWAIFRRGFTRYVVRMAACVVGVYLLLTLLVIVSGLVYLANHAELVEAWQLKVQTSRWDTGLGVASGSDPWSLAGRSLLLFPQLVLGLSGFEVSLVLMPLIRGTKGAPAADLWGRVRNTRKLLTCAAVIMAVLLLGSSLVTTVLLEPAALSTVGAARYRSLAYLAHGGALIDGQTAVAMNPLFGPVFGTVYDLSTVIILCLAGASVTLGLRGLVPQHLQRFGMEFRNRRAAGVLFHVFNLIKLAVTVVFQASVTAQCGAYATSVSVLITSAAFTTFIDRWRNSRMRWRGLRVPWLSLLMSGLFLSTALVIIGHDTAGLQLASGFILATLLLSMLSRWLRNTELRFQGFEFADDHSRFLWESLKPLDFPVLVPHRPGRHSLAEKEDRIRQHHRLPPSVPVVFVEVNVEDASDFYQLPLLQIKQDDGRFTLRITRCASVAHVIAATALELSKESQPPEIHFGWSNESPTAANLNFVLFGHGNVPWMVRELLKRAEPRLDRQPRVIVG